MAADIARSNGDVSGMPIAGPAPASTSHCTVHSTLPAQSSRNADREWPLLLRSACSISWRMTCPLRTTAELTVIRLLAADQYAQTGRPSNSRATPSGTSYHSPLENDPDTPEQASVIFHHSAYAGGGMNAVAAEGRSGSTTWSHETIERVTTIEHAANLYA